MKDFEKKIAKIKSPSASVNEQHKEHLRHVAMTTLNNRAHKASWMKFLLPAAGASFVAIAVVVGIGVFSNVNNTDPVNIPTTPVAKLSSSLTPDEVKSTAVETLKMNLDEKQLQVDTVSTVYTKVKVGTTAEAGAQTDERIVETWDEPTSGASRRVISTADGGVLSTEVKLPSGDEYVQYDIANYSQIFTTGNEVLEETDKLSVTPELSSDISPSVGEDVNTLIAELSRERSQMQLQEVIDTLSGPGGDSELKEDEIWQGFEVMSMQTKNPLAQTTWYFDVTTAGLIGHETEQYSGDGEIESQYFEVTLTDENVDVIDLSVDGFFSTATSSATSGELSGDTFEVSEPELGFGFAAPVEWSVAMSEPTDSGLDYGADSLMTFNGLEASSIQTYPSAITLGQEVIDACTQNGGEQSDVMLGMQIEASRCKNESGNISYTFDVGPRTVEILTIDDAVDGYEDFLASLVRL